jgi:hypothetical protein
MKTKLRIVGWTVLLALSTLNLRLSTAHAQGTAFTYQGRLNSGANPAAGIYDLRFTIYDAAGGGSVWGVLTNAATPVTNGLFTVTLDFGSGVFTGNARWLEIAVRTNGASSFTTLAPRQPLTPTPYAILAGTASNLAGTLPATQISGVVPLAQLPGAVLTNNESGPVTLNGTLTLPATPTVYSGGNVLLHADATYNFFAGASAGNLTTGCSNSTAVGYAALQSTTAGDGNTAIGFETLQHDTSGQGNTALGIDALLGNYTGSYNTANGAYALPDNYTGSYNTAVGVSSLLNNQTGGNNIALGYLAGFYIVGSSNIDIGSEGLPADTGIIRIGTPGIQINTFIAGTIFGDGGGLTNLATLGLGGNSAIQSFFAGPLAGNLTMSGSDNTGVGFAALRNNTSGGLNTASGAYALGAGGLITGSDNTADGCVALAANPPGSYNTANGAWALYDNTSGSGNTAIGFEALYFNVTGQNNIGLGYAAGINVLGNNNIDIGNPGSTYDSGVIRLGTPGTHTNTFIAGVINGNGGGLTNLNAAQVTGTMPSLTLSGNITLPANGIIYSDTTPLIGTYGSGNFFAGLSSGNQTMSGSGNAANGAMTLYWNTSGSYNTANGFQSLYNNRTGSANTAIGAYALNVNWGGSANTAIGYQTLYNNSGGSNNIALGSQAGYNITTGSSNIDIGNPGNSGDNNIIRIGTPGTHTGNLLAGTVYIDPAAQNTGSLIPGPGLIFGGTGSSEGISSKRTSGTDQYGIDFYTQGIVRMTLANNGDVGIGTTTPGNLLVVGGSGSPAYCNGTSWVNGSDRNSKEAFTAINPRAVLEKVSALPITEWKYKTEADGTEHIGPMAQDFHTAFGLNGTDDKHIATVDEEGVALAAIQGLNQKMEAETKAKDAEIQELKQSVAELKVLVEKLAAK